jgi:PEP-CTERM motif
MQIRRLKTWTFALATIGAVLLGGSKQASADILLTVSAGGTTESFDFTSDTLAAQSLTIDGYGLNVETVVTNYPGSNLAGGLISTTVNVIGAVSVSDTLSITAQLITPGSVTPGGPYATPPLGYNTQPLLAWTGPSTTPVTVAAGSSFTPSQSSTSATVTTTTYYDSGPAATLAASTPFVTDTDTYPGGTPVDVTMSAANTGTYTLSQTVVLTGINVGASGFNFGGTSSVDQPTPITGVVPEPSSVVLASLGGLGLIGFGLRRRKALGA